MFNDIVLLLGSRQRRLSLSLVAALISDERSGKSILVISMCVVDCSTTVISLVVVCTNQRRIVVPYRTNSE